ncbi:membrane protein insertion efficiency factor YidD [Fibrella arboris]|uniref:membrane protein insertion efficiency factor YidD n=1 Tax=Fibrella arboris TaxID=3242486 RepID=UPI0035203209
MVHKPHSIVIEGQEVELLADPSLTPGILRALTGTTPLDDQVDNLLPVIRPLWLAVITKTLRWYRFQISPKLGQRCVYEPSCSRYSELAFRKYGLFKGFSLTVKRLKRCKPGMGGTDMP